MHACMNNFFLTELSFQNTKMSRKGQFHIP